jgi:hypothetical protein
VRHGRRLHRRGGPGEPASVSRPALGPSAPRIRSRTWLRGGSDVALAPAPVQRGDDGRGGADLAGGSGLVGLEDRMEALGGRLSVQSAPGVGTTVQSALSLDPARCGLFQAPTVDDL